jgi:hypothetical protein
MLLVRGMCTYRPLSEIAAGTDGGLSLRWCVWWCGLLPVDETLLHALLRMVLLLLLLL